MKSKTYKKNYHWDLKKNYRAEPEVLIEVVPENLKMRWCGTKDIEREIYRPFIVTVIW